MERRVTLPINRNPATPLDAYKAIIDQLVEETTNGIGERLIRQLGVYSKASANAEANEFVQSLSNDQRLLLAKMLRDERVGTIHDFLADLTWWFTCRDVRLTFHGQPMPFGASEGIHGDYIGRLNGWKWPEDPKEFFSP